MKRNIWFKNIALLLAAMFFVGDRALKSMAVSGDFKMPVNLLGSWFQFDFTPNYFIAFSLPWGGKSILILTGIIIFCLLFYILYLFFSKKLKWRLFFPLMVLFLGALSNFIDRIQYGYVIDYFSCRYFTIFNLADVLIVAVVGWFLLEIIRKKGE
ncbi:MAG: signal peptidase II [Patescibacteria group bacterium]|jgi:signal peptidase II